MKWVSGLPDAESQEVSTAEPMAQTVAPTAPTMLKAAHRPVPTALGRLETAGEPTAQGRLETAGERKAGSEAN
ncbi:MAG TPA: hypothetical protein VK542_08870 [Gemmatimonadaceae bacterium]|nr:hypothetical protein [Gemmatimonadaceae bacterium]